MDLTIFSLGLIVFLVALAVVVGGFAFYRRNIKSGSESKDPNKFTQ